jgi:hypothetical protein
LFIMADYSLVPVEHQPDFENVSLVPVDHDPFSADGVTQQARAQTQRPQSSESRGNLPDVGPPLIGDGGQFSAGTAFGNKAADITSKVAYGMMKQVATLPQRAMDASRESFEHRYGPPPSTISDSNVWVDPLIPIAAETAMMMAAPASLMAERGAAGALGGKLPLRPSPEILPEELSGQTRSQIRGLALDKGLAPKGDSLHPDYPRRWSDPVTNQPRLRLDRGHFDAETGQPFDNANAAVDHVHGYDVDGNSIKIEGDRHIPTKGE